VNTSKKLLLVGTVAFTSFFLIIGCAHTPEANHSMLSVLGQFEDAPAIGPGETNMPARRLPTPDALAALSPLPGQGLAQHPFLYYGEGNNVLYVVNHGKVIWTYAFPKGGEIDDAWMLSNGHIVCTTMRHCYEVTPDKKIVWSYDCPAGREIHALQPLGLDQVMVVENGLPPRLYVLNKKDNSKALDRELPAVSATDSRTVHTQFRNCRLTARGTYLLPFLREGKIVEYDKNWNEVWTIKADSPWSAVRLKNGNTLVPGDYHTYVHELSPDGKLVWAIEKNDLPGIELRGIQTVNRLDNGNTVFCNRSSSTNNPFAAVQVIEVTPDKKVVWALREWTALGPATGVQLLDQVGRPEVPGDLQR
jgi:hypothetical protein